MTYRILVTTALALVLINASCVNAQTDFEPRIVILAPNQIFVEGALRSEVDSVSRALSVNINSAQRVEGLNKLLADPRENVQIMCDYSLKFIPSIDFLNYAAFFAHEYLQFRIFERFQNLMVYPITDTSDGSELSMLKYANTHEARYVINFLSIRVSYENGLKRGELRYQLYDSKEREFVIDEIFDGGTKNPGFYFACADGSLICTITNALSIPLQMTLAVVADRNEGIRRERELASRRTEILIKDYLTAEPDKEITRIIKSTDTSISTAGYFQGFTDSSSEKFIGFFTRKKRAGSVMDVGEPNVTIESSDPTNLSHVPSSIGYIVVGVKWEGRWFVKKDRVTMFEAKTTRDRRRGYFSRLRDWGFFKDGETSLDPEFWESGFFARVRDVTKDPDFEKYYESIYKREERENRGYIGIYEIVADGLRREKQNVRMVFERELNESLLIPYYDELMLKSDPLFTKYKLENDRFLLIYPETQDVVLNPLICIDEEGTHTLRFFVALPDSSKVYEWVYFESIDVGLVGRGYFEVIKSLKLVTDWNYSFKTLDDEVFWGVSVLSRDSLGYRYLRQR